MTSRAGSVHGGFWELEKSQELSFSVGRRRLTFGVHRGQASSLRRGMHVVWGRWKSQHRKIVYLFPYVEKPFNSKVIKSFVPELRSRKCFSCFGIPMLSKYVIYIYMDIMNVLRIVMDMYISHIHVYAM